MDLAIRNTKRGTLKEVIKYKYEGWREIRNLVVNRDPCSIASFVDKHNPLKPYVVDDILVSVYC